MFWDQIVCCVMTNWLRWIGVGVFSHLFAPLESIIPSVTDCVTIIVTVRRGVLTGVCVPTLFLFYVLVGCSFLLTAPPPRELSFFLSQSGEICGWYALVEGGMRMTFLLMCGVVRSVCGMMNGEEGMVLPFGALSKWKSELMVRPDENVGGFDLMFVSCLSEGNLRDERLQDRSSVWRFGSQATLSGRDGTWWMSRDELCCVFLRRLECACVPSMLRLAEHEQQRINACP